jgi:hypothetical protein
MQLLRLRSVTLASGVVALLISGIADAQWVIVARHAIGRVQQMSQQSQQQSGPSYDSAAVMLEAPAEKVYVAVLKGLSNAPGVTITRQDPAASLVQFTSGQQIAGIKLSALNDNLTHMMISSAHSGTQADAAEVVMDHVLRVCREVRLECSKAQQ